MSKINSFIRNSLHGYYTPQEVACFSRIICCDVFGQSSVDFYLGKDISLSPKEEQKLADILQQLMKYCPIQYVLGEARFLGRTFYVAQGVLIPRPETEEMVEMMLREIPKDAHVLDIGTGSGCIAVTLSKELPHAKVEAWDISERALEIAKSNNEALNASVGFKLCDVLAYQSVAEDIYDVIVSNPPYIAEKEKCDMQPNVLDWEPDLALFVPDEDPLRFYRRIGEIGMSVLLQGGLLYFEINRAYGNDVVEMLQTQGYQHVRLEKDLSGNDRFVVAQKVK